MFARAPVARGRGTALASFACVHLGICIAIAALVAIALLRRLLAPLEQLRQGALRIGRADFDARVTLSTGDEFEALAGSFNAMAGRIRGQFSQLETVLDIDLAILSQTDTQASVECVVARTRELYSCDLVLAVVSDPEVCADTGAIVARQDEPGSAVVRLDEPSPPGLDAVLAPGRDVWQPLGGSEPAGLELLSGAATAWRSACSISTTSNGSTTRSGTAPGTSS